VLPSSIISEVEEQTGLRAGDASPVSGGDINRACKLQMNDGQLLFLKWNQQAPARMFETEAKGLQLLSAPNTGLFIPEAIAFGRNWLLMEYLQTGPPGADAPEEFGRSLGRLHRSSNDDFGLDHDNFIGRLPQSNRKHSGWHEFFISERIEPQIRMATDSGKFDRSINQVFKRFTLNTKNLFPEEPPALLHGDLWSGNYAFTKNGSASVYDPAVYYGHREMDIGMTLLFGGFSSGFYRGYNEVYPLEKKYKSRVDVCQLYPLLVHANLFGGGYVQRSRSILKSYA